MAISAFDIADHFIHVANESESLLTNLKLQKLVYYAQAWHLAIFGKPIFKEDFQAWVHGPVIPELYRKYSSFKWHPIDKKVSLPKDKFPKVLRNFLEDVTEVYFRYDAFELELMIHAEAPWIEARGKLSKQTPSNKVISKESMKRFYSRRVKKEEKEELNTRN